MISREDLEHISIDVKDYGNGWYDTKLYYKGKLIATYPCSGHRHVIVNEENYQKLELDEKIDKELKEGFPKTMLTDEQFNRAKEIASGPHKLEAVKYIYSIIPDEGFKGARIYFDLYLDDKNNL